LLQVCRPEQLHSDLLREQIGTALRTSPQDLQKRARAALNFDGARQAAGRLLALIREPAPGGASDAAPGPSGVS